MVYGLLRTAAFPSLYHNFIWVSLAFLGILGHFVAIIQMLYSDNYHCLRMLGSILPGFTVTRGVKQGDPLSMMLFVICLSHFIRSSLRLVGPDGLVRGFADDLVIGGPNFTTLGPCLRSFFRFGASFLVCN